MHWVDCLSCFPYEQLQILSIHRPYYEIFNYRKFPLTPGRIIVDLYHIANPDLLLVGSSGALVPSDIPFSTGIRSVGVDGLTDLP